MQEYALQSLANCTFRIISNVRAILHACTVYMYMHVQHTHTCMYSTCILQNSVLPRCSRALYTFQYYTYLIILFPGHSRSPTPSYVVRGLGPLLHLLTCPHRPLTSSQSWMSSRQTSRRGKGSPENREHGSRWTEPNRSA